MLRADLPELEGVVIAEGQRLINLGDDILRTFGQRIELVLGQIDLGVLDLSRRQNVRKEQKDSRDDQTSDRQRLTIHVL